MRSLFCWAAALLLCGGGAFAYADIRIAGADDHGLNIEFTLNNLRESGGSFTFDGAVPGKPYAAAALALPPDSKPTAVVLSKTTRRVPLTRFPKAQGLPETYSPDLVAVRAVGYFRDQYLGALQIRPAAVDGSDLVVTETALVRIEFGAAPSVSPGIQERMPRSEAMTAAFERLLLNSRQAERWRVGRVRPRAAPALTQESGDIRRVKVLVLETALYRLSPNALRSAGVDPETIDPNTFRMMRLGNEIAVDVIDENQNARFDGNDMLLFYGERVPHNRFGLTNAYMLEWGEKQGRRPLLLDGKPKTLDAPQPRAFRAPRFFEENVFHHNLESQQNDQIDHYFWTGFTGVTRKTPVVYDLSDEANDISEPAVFRILLHGGQNSQDPHEFKVYIGQNRIGTLNWKGQESKYGEFTFPQRFIAEKTGFTFVSNDDNGTDLRANNYDILLDWYEIDYWRKLEYSRVEPRGAYISDRLYPVVESGPVVFRIRGFPTQSPLAYRVGFTGLEAKFNNLDRQLEGADPRTYTISFEDSQGTPAKYAVVRLEDVKQPLAVLPAPHSGLRSPSIKGDYLIIAHPEFMEALEPLKEHRERQGFHVAVANIEDLYNDFNHGRFSPFAVKTFLRTAYQSWEIPPEYVLLVGDGHYNYKGENSDYFMRQINPEIAEGYANFVPTIHGWSDGGLEGGGETAMDHRFATIEGDDAVPDLHIGRLPVHTLNELRSVIQKIIAYETESGPSPEWRSKVIHISDNSTTHNGDHVFRTSREELIREYTPPGYDVEKIYLRDKAPSNGKWDPPEEATLPSSREARERIIEAVSDGALLLEYAGHGGRSVWADEDILRTEDILRMRNGARQPVVIATTCLINAFDSPEQLGQRSMGEEFLLRSRAGASGVIGATRKTYANCNIDFDNIFFPILFHHPSNRIGELLTVAKVEADLFAKIERSRYCEPGLMQYTLFGDPAMQLQRPDFSVEVKVKPEAVDPQQQLRVLQGAVLNMAVDPPMKVADFDGQMRIELDFPNNLDPYPNNDRAAVEHTVPVIGGEFLDSPQLTIPADLSSWGEAAARVFAQSHDGKQTAVGGVWFSIGQARILSVSSERKDDSLYIFAEAVHPEGPDGISKVTAHWKNTEDHVWNETPMSRKEGGSFESVEGIPLPRFGRSILYYVRFEDAGGRPEVVSETQRFRMPEGPNLAIRQIGSTRIPELSYGFDEELQKWVFRTTVVNLGDHRPEIPFEVLIIRGPADADGNRVLDDDPPPEILAQTIVYPDQWLPGDPALGEWEQAPIVLPLEKPLSSGSHDITVWVDPERPDDPADAFSGKIYESREMDNITRKPFEVSDFYIGEEDITAYSLDRTFFIDVPKEAAPSPTTLSISLLPPMEKDLSEGPDAPYGRAQYQRIRNNDKTAFEVKLTSGETMFKAPAQLRIGFNYQALKDDVARDLDLPFNPFQWSIPQHTSHDKAVKEALNFVSVYQWDEELAAWRRIPSTLDRGEDGQPIESVHITPPLYNNLESSNLRFHGDIEVDSTIGRIGKWAVMFISHHKYIVMLSEGGGHSYDELSIPGTLDVPYKNETVYLRRMLIRNIDPEGPSSAASAPAQPGDVLTFETVSENGIVHAKNIRYSNAGDGSVTLNLRANVTVEDAPYGDWFVFFINDTMYEIRDGQGAQIINSSGRTIHGAVNGPEINIGHIGLKFQAFKGNRPFEFGDLARARIGQAMTVRGNTETVGIFTLMRDKDLKPPAVQIFVDNETPAKGSVIEPQPDIAFLITDPNGIDPHMIQLLHKAPGAADFQTVPPDQYSLDRSQIVQISLRMEPALYVGEHAFQLRAVDLTGLEAQGAEFNFKVERPPDFDPPTIALHSEQGAVSPNHIFTKTPQTLTLHINDDHILNMRSLQLTVARKGEEGETPEPLAYEFQRPDPKTARISWGADLPNGEYEIRASFQDVTENEGYLSGQPNAPFQFAVEEPTRLIGRVLNAPNPFSPIDPVTRGTFFTYALTQPAESVTVRVYTSAGRLVKTIDDAPAERGKNEYRWDGRSDDGETLANGVYFYKFRMESWHFDQKEAQERFGKLVILR